MKTGFVNAAPDDDGIVRSALLSAEKDGTVYRSFAAQTYSAYCEYLGINENTPALDNSGRMWISYAGKPSDYEHIPLCSLLDGTVDPKIFTDCIVIVGAYASGLQDQFSVPACADQMFGAEIHANIVQGLLDGKYPVPVGRVISALTAAGVACCVYILSRKLKMKFSTPVVIIAAAGCVGGGIVLNSA